MPELFIDGQWRDASDQGRREIRCPADGVWVATVSEATGADTADAIEAARHAFDHGPWPGLSAHERGQILLTVADAVHRERERFALAESQDTGKRLPESRFDVDDVTACLRYFGTLAGTDDVRTVDTGRADVASEVRYEPIGVCGLITPWNYPLLQAAWKLAPALAAGNTMVIKPSELTPSTTILLVQALAEAGVPAGVVNLVLGEGARAGAPLSTHPAVDLVSFTGGPVAGRAIASAAAAGVKRIVLELGGKNPNVVFADTDLDTAVDYALTAAFLHSGQVCSAGARLIVEDRLHDHLVDAVVDRARRIRLGGPLDPDAETGPLISAAHLARVEDYVASGLAEGAVLRCGGRRPSDPALAKGFYYPPTVLDECRSGMRVVVEEAFGPVLTVERFPDQDEDEAVRLANDTDYGLAGAVWTGDAQRARRVASRLRHGTVWINDYHPYVPQAEWGGFKRSGIGRELGPTGLNEYRQTKHLWTNLAPHPTLWFRR